MTTTGGEYNSKRLYIRTKAKKKCILRVNRTDTGGGEALFVETLDHSDGGLGIIYDGEKISVGNRILVYIETLNIFRKEAEVVWLNHLNGDCAAGLRWV